MLHLSYTITVSHLISSLNRMKEKESNKGRGRFKDRKGKCDWSKGRCVWPGSQQSTCAPPAPQTLLQPIDPAVLPKSGWWRTLSASVLQWEQEREWRWVSSAQVWQHRQSSDRSNNNGDILNFTLDHTLSIHAAFKWNQANEEMADGGHWKTDKWSDGMTGWQNDTYATICFAQRCSIVYNKLIWIH